LTYERLSRIIDFQFGQIAVGYKIVLFFLLSRECETWPFVLRGELRLRVNEKMVPRKIFVVKNEYV